MKRIKFLKKYLQYLESDRYVFVCLDETRIFKNGSQMRRWLNVSDPKEIPKNFKGEDKRLTILHAGASAGFLPRCDLLLNFEIENRDYHKNMDSRTFIKWIRDQLLPALNSLDKPAVIIMNNALYHSVQLDKAAVLSTRKGKMIRWLNQNQILYFPAATKPVL